MCISVVAVQFIPVHHHLGAMLPAHHQWSGATEHAQPPPQRIALDGSSSSCSISSRIRPRQAVPPHGSVLLQWRQQENKKGQDKGSGGQEDTTNTDNRQRSPLPRRTNGHDTHDNGSRGHRDINHKAKAAEDKKDTRNTEGKWRPPMKANEVNESMLQCTTHHRSTASK